MDIKAQGLIFTMKSFICARVLKLPRQMVGRGRRRRRRRRRLPSCHGFS